MNDMRKTKAQLITELDKLRKAHTEHTTVIDPTELSKKCFGTLSELLPHTVFLCRNDERHTLLFLSGNAEDLTGFTVDSFLTDQTGLTDLFHPDDTEIIIPQIYRALDERSQFHFMCRIRHKTGKWRLAEVFGKGVFEESETLFIEGCIAEYTGRRETEKKLQRSYHIVNNINVGLYIYHLEDIDDTEGRTLKMISANKAAAEMTGVPVKDVVGRTLDENFPHLRERWTGKHGKSIPELYAEVALTGRPIELEDVYYGDERVIEGAFAVKAFPLPDNCVGVSFDNITMRVKTEEALRKSEEQYRFLTEHAQDVIYRMRTNPALTFEYASPSTAAMTGYTPEEHYADPDMIYKLVHTEDHHLLDSILHNSDTGTETLVLRFVRKDGEIIWVDNRITWVYDTENHLLALEWIARDITEHKRADDALKESEEKFHLLFSTVSEAIVVFDSETRSFIDVNDSAIRLYGYTRDEFLKRTYWDITAEPDESDAAIRETLTGKRDKVPIRYHKKSDGTVFPVEIFLGAFTIGNRKVLCGAIRDITERVASLQALRASEEKYRMLTENTNDIVFTIDTQGIVTYIAPQIMLYGFTQDEIVSKHFTTFMYPDDIERVSQDFHTSISNGREFLTQFRIMDKRGTVHWFEDNGKIQIGESGNIAGITGVLRDITDRRKIEDELKSAQEELEAKAQNLEETNTALKVLLKHQDSEKIIMEKNILSSLDALVMPYLRKITLGTADEMVRTYVDIIINNLSEITKPFTDQISARLSKLTPTEMQIATLISDKKSSKDIADILHMSEKTVFFYRKNIRTKLGLKNKKTNLQSYLQSHLRK